MKLELTTEEVATAVGALIYLKLPEFKVIADKIAMQTVQQMEEEYATYSSNQHGGGGIRHR